MNLLFTILSCNSFWLIDILLTFPILDYMTEKENYTLILKLVHRL